MAAHPAQEETTSVPKKRAPSKVATKKVATKKVVEKPVAVKRVATKRIPRRTIEADETPVRRIPKSTRKAPTTIPARGPAKHFPFAVALSVGAFVVAFGTSAVVGLQGHGAIDVAQVIEARAQRVSQQGDGNADEASAVAAAASNANSPTSNTPNGGLRGSGAESPSSESEAGPVAVDESEQITFVDAASSTDPATPPEEEVPEGEVAPETVEETPAPEVPQGE